MKYTLFSLCAHSTVCAPHTSDMNSWCKMALPTPSFHRQADHRDCPCTGRSSTTVHARRDHPASLNKIPIKQPHWWPIPESMCSIVWASISSFSDRRTKLFSASEWKKWHQAEGPLLGTSVTNLSMTCV